MRILCMWLPSSFPLKKKLLCNNYYIIKINNYYGDDCVTPIFILNNDGKGQRKGERMIKICLQFPLYQTWEGSYMGSFPGRLKSFLLCGDYDPHKSESIF